MWIFLDKGSECTFVRMQDTPQLIQFGYPLFWMVFFLISPLITTTKEDALNIRGWIWLKRLQDKFLLQLVDRYLEDSVETSKYLRLS